VTIIEHRTRTTYTSVQHDLYRNIHKAIRGELFAVVVEAGRIDPADLEARSTLAGHVDEVVALLESHAEHEDRAISPALELHRPDLAELIASDHLRLDRRVADLQEMATAAVGTSTPAGGVHRLYLELSSFTSTYLEHQDVEEQVVMPALESAVGPEAVMAIHQAILASIPPGEMATTLALMLPRLNIDERCEMLGGLRAGAPAEVFAGVWALAGSVLTPSDHAALGRRLDVG
jgi:hypothetical protein